MKNEEEAKMEDRTFEKFWILWNPDGNTPPKVVFKTYDGALTESKRLIAQIGRGTVYVMEAVSSETVEVNVKHRQAALGPAKETA